MGQYKAELTLSPCLHVKPLITAIRAVACVYILILKKKYYVRRRKN